MQNDTTLTEPGETIRQNTIDRIRTRIGDGAATVFNARFQEKLQDGTNVVVAATEAEIEVVQEIIDRQQSVTI